tara:strand:+ start:826 stop:1032 length:207 start_codon:yes stop_codon:yes gene_type:complete
MTPTEFDTCPACEQEISALHPMGEGYLACNICEALYNPNGKEIGPSMEDLNACPPEVIVNYNELCEGW